MLGCKTRRELTPITNKIKLKNVPGGTASANAGDRTAVHADKSLNGDMDVKDSGNYGGLVRGILVALVA